MAVINGLSDNYEVLTGTTENDTLKGGKGNDAINGGNGRDTAIYSGNSSDYSFQATPLSLQITDLHPEDRDEGEDYLTGIEFIQFADRTLQISPGGPIQANNTENAGSPSTTILADGGWLVAWNNGIQRYDFNGNPINTTVPLDGYEPSISALPDGGWLATYQKIGSGYNSDIFVCRYDAQGQPQGSATLVDSHSSISSLSIEALDNGDWLASWQAGPNSFIQRFDALGQPQGDKAQINTTGTVGLQNVCSLPDGGWLVTWNGFKSGIGREIFLQRYDSAGQKVDGEVLVSEGGAAYLAPSTALLADGSWLVSWWSEGANYSGHLYTQRFDAHGTPIGDTQALTAPVLVIGASSPPNVAALPDGGWVVAWSQGIFSDMTKRVHLQRFDQDGKPAGNEFAYTASDTQYTPQLDVLPDGGWILTWQSGHPTNGNGTGDVFFQRFDAQGVPYLPTVHGTEGDDHFQSSGTSAFAGEAGNDTYIISSSDVRIKEEIGSGEDSVISTASFQLPENVENLILSGSLNTSGFGNEQNNSITGNSHNNTLRGNAGNDTLDGASGTDTADYQSSNAGINVNLSLGLALNDGFSGSDTLISIENITGSAHSDIIYGDRNANIIIGNQGNDFISGGAGNDRLVGGAGQDTAIYSGNAKDYLFSWKDGYLTVVDLNTLDGDDGSDQLREIENIQFSNQIISIGSSGISRANTTTDNLQDTPIITGLSDGGWIVTWNAYDQDSPLTTGIFSQRYDAAGIPVGEEIQVNTTEQGNQNCNSAIGLTDGGWLVTWSGQGIGDNSGVFTQRYDANGNRIGTETLVTQSAAAPIATLLADGGWLLAWCDNVDGADNFFAQRFSVDGDKIGNVTQITSTATNKLAAFFSINSVSDGGWMAVWNDNRATYVQRFDTNGVAVAAAKRVNDDLSSKLTQLSNGDWLLSYEGASSTDFRVGLHVQHLDSNGNIKGTSELIGVNGSGHDIVTLANGDVLLIWDATVELQFQRFDGYGNRIGAISAVKNAGTGDNSVVTALADGGWVVAWQAENLGSSDIYTQRYDAQGKPFLLEITGSPQNDILNGAGPVLLVGGSGDDTYKINNVQTEVRENDGEGTDIILSYISSYVLGANIENGRVMSTGSANLTGNALNNIIYAGSGHNILNGGDGTDTVSYQYATGAITANLAITSAQATGGSGSDTLIAIENLSGSSYNDTLTGNSSANKLSGGLGNDVLNGGAGADTMIGGDGSDTYYVDHANDAVSETNADTGTGGTDTVYTYLAQYNLGTNIENGRVMSTGSANLTGNALNNTLYAGTGNNTLNGGSGTDTASYQYATGAITANLAITSAQATGGSGSDTLIAIENLSGSSYNDTLTGNSSANKLSGGLGNDVLNGGAGADIMIGGDGSDTYYVDHANDAVSETNADTGTGGIDIVYTYITHNLSANIENGRVMSTDSVNLTGNALNNILYAGAGNNTLNGGSGTDTASYQYATGAITANLAITSAQATGGSGSDTLIAIENLSGSSYNDTLTGNSSANKLSGGLGNDVLNGGAGADTMIGGDGSDTYYVDHAGDLVSETNPDASSGGTDLVLSYLTRYTLGANIENGRVLADISANMTGNDLNNVLTAGNGNNILDGANGFDTASYAHAASAVTINLSKATAQATGGSGADTLISMEGIIGSNYNDVLNGSTVGNILNGGAGNDRLFGAAGADILIGGNGNDTFIFAALTDSGLTSSRRDIISDFTRGTDKIDLSRLDANANLIGDDAFAQIIDSTAAFTVAGQLRLTDGVLYGNTDDDAGAEFSIQLIGVSSVSLADFIA